jgi:transaldolase
VNALTRLVAGGQSIWLDNITRQLLTSGTLARYVEEFSVTGLTSNPTIFERAISGSADYDDSIKKRLDRPLSPEQLFFELAIEDLTVAAGHFRPVYEASGGTDGFVSLEVSPTLADDSAQTIEEARRLHAHASCENLLIKVPGTAAGAVAVEELTFLGIPVNVTLLFSTEHYEAAAGAYTNGIERRVAAGLDPVVPSVASLFISRWDTATAEQLPEGLRDRVGIAVGRRSHDAFVRLHSEPRWRRLAAAGARPQKLLWASTGTKNPALPEGYYVNALATAGTINTMPEKTLLALISAGEVGETSDTTPADRVLESVEAAGVDLAGVATRLQADGRDAFVADFEKLIRCMAEKVSQLT